MFTKHQGIVVTGFTGILSCNFGDFHRDVETRLGRPVWTHEFASKELTQEIKELYKEDFLSLVHVEA